ncbi:gliding motility-associated C-terminal domain-containing protein [Chryseolinea serpens]|uniref:Gliding motility-associated C-terminal domain-containing protein n=2 Tax=Chryseolinea serpens TaxID=947013 RepID=A0A1M5KD97_9BACT|nr:gliding motility-associated C-terminal domain-containing protein [Chryseolinea serpens]
MPKLLRRPFFWLVFIISALNLFSFEAFSQGCNGLDHTGIFTGSIANRDNGTTCANSPITPGLIEIDINNVDDSGGASLIQYEINWDDGSAPQRVNAAMISTGRYFASATHFFPPNGGQVKCEYRPDVRLVVDNAVCAANLGTPPRFVRWNTDDENTGRLSLLETLTNVNEYLVCAGVETNVTFTDRSILNCVPPDLVLGPNDKQRWRQFIYGTGASNITGAVKIGGTPRTFPFNGTVDASPVSVTNSGFPTATTQIITVPATAQVGEIFEITMNYWNTCNPYNVRPPVIETARIRIVDQPPPPTGTDQTVCNGTTPSNFNVLGVPAGNLVTWYRNVPGSPDAPGTPISTGTSTSLPVSSVPGYTNNTTAGNYIVWATYRPNVANALNCESPAVKLTKTIREAITVPNPTTAPPAQICNGNSFNVVMPAPATTTFGGTTEYVFTGDTGVTPSGTTATSTTFNVAVAFAPGQLYVDRNVRVSRRYTSNPNCTTDRDFTVRVFNQTVPGTLSGVPNACEGTSVGPLTLSGYVGTIDHWEVEINGGGFNTYTGPASGSSITPGVLTAGTYAYRAVVDNGPCATVNSNTQTVVITPNPTPPTAGADQAFCGSLTSLPLTATLTAGTGTWSYKSSVPAGRPAPGYTTNANDPNTALTIGSPTLAGEYTMVWTVVTGSCTFTDEVIIDFGANPTPIAAMPAISACGETATLAAPVPTIGTGVWTVTGGSAAALTIVDPTSPTTDVTLNGPAFAYGAYVLEWRVTSGNCPAAFNSVTVTYYQKPQVAAPDVNNVCLLPGAAVITPITIAGTYGGGSNGGTFSVVTGNGSIVTIISGGGNLSATYNANNADYLAGTPLKMKATAIPQPGSTCAAADQDFTINVDRKPVADAGPSPLNVCETSVQMSAQNPAPFGATGKWTVVSGSATISDDTDPNATIGNLPAPGNSVTVRWTLTSAGGNLCTDFDDVVINRITAPSASNLTPLLCEVAPAGAPVTTTVLLTDYESAITAVPAANRTIQWYEDGPPPLGTLVADPTVPFMNVPDGKVYIARIKETATGCTSDGSVSINIRPLPSAQDATVALCEDTPGSNTTSNVDLIGDPRFKNAVTTPGNAIAWFNTLPDAQNNVNPIVAPIASVVGSKDVYARVTYMTLPSCPTIVKLTLQVNLLPNDQAIIGDPTVCMGASGQPVNTLPVQTYQVTSVPGAKYYWTVPTGPGQFIVFAGGTVNDFYVLLQFPYTATPTAADIKVRIELNGCSTSDVPLTILRSPQPVAPIITGDPVVCENDNSIPYHVSLPNPASNYNWEIRRQSDNSIGGAFVSSGQTFPDIFVEFSNEDVVIAVTEVNNVCVSPEGTYNVQVNKRPIMADNDQAVCSDTPTNIVFAKSTGPGPVSPVDIDKYTINDAIYSAGLGYITPNAPETFPQTNLAADFIQNHVFENLSASPLPVSYTVTPISEVTTVFPMPIGPITKECPGTPQIITVTVRPQPQLSPGLDKMICSDEPTGITLISRANTFPADRFIINSIIVPPGVAPTSAIPVADGTTLYLDDVIHDNTWVNTTGVNQDVKYVILPYSSSLGCAGSPATTVTVTIYPRSDVDPVVVPNLCNGDPLNVAFTSPNNSDANFLWLVKSYDPNINIGSPAAGLGNISNMILTNTSSTLDGVVTFEVRAKNPSTEEGAGGCTNPPQTFTVTVLKSPVANGQILTVCSDVPGGTTYTADLTALEISVTPDAGTPTTAITWYTSDPRLGPAAAIPAANLPAYVVTNGVPLFVEVVYTPTGCKKVVTVTHTVNPSMSINKTITDLKCNGDNTGEITITVTNGTPVYSYRIDGGPFINAGTTFYTFSALAAGGHSVEVQDSKGCTLSDVITVVEPVALTSVLNIDQQITCFLGKDGIISTAAAGGTAPYSQYLLLQTNTTDPNNDGIFDNLGVGSYNVRVTDAHNCTTTSNPVTLVQPTQVEINSMASAVDANGFNLSCHDYPDGEIATTFSGGNSPQDYTLTLTKSSDPANPIIANTTTNGHTFLNLLDGNYTMIVKDVKGCPSLPASAIIGNPPVFNPGFIGSDQAICIGQDPVAIIEQAPPSGGVLNYKFRWQMSFTNNDADFFDILPAETGPTYDPPAITQTTYYRRLVESVSTRTGVSCDVKGKDNIVKVTVNPLPEVLFSGASQLCEGLTLVLNIQLNVGRAPIEYDYSAGSDTYVNLAGTASTNIEIPNFSQTQTYKLLRVKDANGCVATDVPQTVTTNVIKINSDFQVLAPDAQCSGGTFTFQWFVEPDVTYTWDYTDGSQDVFLPGSIGLGTQTVSHVFTAGSTQNNTIYPVKLTASNPGSGCSDKFSTNPIKVFPRVSLNITPGDPILCSGESIRFKDQSEGVDIGHWYYHEIGKTDRLDERTGPLPDVTFVMTNNTTTNPIVYEVVYEANNNEGCGDVYKKEVKVYRGVTAAIGNVPDPPSPFVGGVSTVQFINNSTPVDPTQFEYTWDFDDIKATPPSANGAGPFTVDYFSPGVKNVILKAVNIDARDIDNKQCVSAVSKPINIELPLLKAAFKATPLAACFPVDITVENLSPGADTFYWELYDQNGLVTTSNLREPVFRILKPGKYDIYLTASFLATGQTDFANQKGIEVYDVPSALFQLRPNPLYVPDTEMQTFNQSLRASQYEWDFNDGDKSNEFQPRHLYKLEGKYIVTLTAGYDNGNKDVDGDGVLDGNIVCYDTAQQEVTALDGGFIKLPNAFTPNPNGSTGGVPGNGTFNDVFLPITRGVQEFAMQIFDRWGNLIFESKDKNIGWDGYDKNGRLMPAGVYVYKLVLRLSDGQRTTKLGDVTLIR